LSWQLVILFVLGSLLILMATGLPVAFCFLFVNIVLVTIFWGGGNGLQQFILSLFSSLSTFTLLPLPMFILMGELLFHSDIGPQVIDALDKWLGRMPGRLSFIAVGAGVIFSTLTGSSLTSVVLLGTVLLPEMERRGYKKPMTLGPIMGSGGLAMLIPPSGLAVLLGALGEISIGKLLLGIIFPGLLIAVLFAAYILIRCILQPSIAPPYSVKPPPLSEKLRGTVLYILPLGFVIFAVIGVIIVGIATPTEGAATGALSLFILTLAYRKMNWTVLKKSFSGTVKITGMIFLIIAGAKAFSQVLAFSGATRGMIKVALGLPLSPLMVLVMMMFILILMGMFVDVVSMMMITLPLFMPVVQVLGFDPVWFGVLFLINVEVAMISPPFGMSLFAMKGVVPKDTSMGDIYRAAIAFCLIDVVAMGIIIAVPKIALWLPQASYAIR